MKVRFLCESCGKSVPYKAQRCPYCGKFFSAVECPQCKYTGRAQEFLAGCPLCGYLEAGGKRNGKAAGSTYGGKKKKKTLITLPLWFYRWAGILLVVILVSILVWYFIYKFG